MNNLIRTCEAITLAGYTREAQLHFTRPGWWYNEKLLSLGDYLLSHNQPEKVNWDLRDEPGLFMSETRMPTSHESGRWRILPSTGYPPHKLAIMFGAGVDSTAAVYRALDVYNPDQVIALWVNYGQPYAEKEHTAIARMIAHKVFPVEINLLSSGVQMRDDPDWGYIFPARNLFLAAIGSYYADRVWIVSTWRGDGADCAADKTDHFYTEASSVFSRYYQRDVTVETPVGHLTKAQLVGDMVQYHPGEGVRALLDSTTCYHSQLLRCGKCSSCYKRWVAFTLNGLVETYAELEPPEYDVFWEKYLPKERSYGKTRAGEVELALTRWIVHRASVMRQELASLRSDLSEMGQKVRYRL